MARFLSILLLLAAVLVALGFYFDWFNLSRREVNNTTEYVLSVDKERVRKDTEAAVQSGKEALEKTRQQAEEFLDRKSVDGQLTEVTADAITVRPEKDQPIHLKVNEKTTVERKGERLSLSQLEVGNNVRVIYATEDGVHIARTITILSK